MTPRQAIAAFDDQVRALGSLPEHLLLTVYDSPAALSAPGESATPADLAQQRRCVDALTEHARAKGVIVRHRQFRAAEYTAWLAGRADTRALRAEYTAIAPVE